MRTAISFRHLLLYTALLLGDPVQMFVHGLQYVCSGVDVRGSNAIAVQLSVEQSARITHQGVREDRRAPQSVRGTESGVVFS